MRERWQNLSLREKQSVAAAGVVVGLFLIYILIWSPLTSKTDELRDSIKHEQSLLSWMQEADKEMRNYVPQSEGKTFTSTAALLAWVQASVQQSSLSKQLTQLRARGTDSIELQMQNVSFDEFIAWLMKAQSQQHFKINQLSVTKTNVPGVVQVELVLQA